MRFTAVEFDCYSLLAPGTATPVRRMAARNQYFAWHSASDFEN